MKSKRFTQKLMLNKETVAHLDHGEMSHALGGGSKDFCTQGACTKKCETFPVLACTTACPYPTG